jgi:hypothetical protein
MSELKIYVAGKVSKESTFGTHYWRDGFVEKLSKLSGRKLISLDPAQKKSDQNDYEEAFGADLYMISQSDVVVVYLSDDISVGGSQEILIAKYFNKPVIGLAPLGGKFNHKNKRIFGQTIGNYRHPFVYSTCDIVCNDIDSVAKALKEVEKIRPKTIDIIDLATKKYKEKYLKSDKYISGVLSEKNKNG